MIYIDSKLCNGCGICVDVCPTAAIVMRDNIAVVNDTLCKDCQVCVNECPRGAILLHEQVVSTIPASQVEILPPEANHASFPVVAAVGAAIVEVLPRLASLTVNWLENRQTSTGISTRNAAVQSPTQTGFRQSNGRRRNSGQGKGRGRGQGRGRGRGQGRGQGGGRGRGNGQR